MRQEPKPVTTPESFFALDVRVGRVLEATPHPSARVPALVVRVDFGGLGPRTTSARIAHHAPADLVGRLVVGVVNIGARRIGGVASEFLLLGAYGDDGTVRLLAPDAGAQAGDAVG